MQPSVFLFLPLLIKTPEMVARISGSVHKLPLQTNQDESLRGGKTLKEGNTLRKTVPKTWKPLPAEEVNEASG